MARVNSRVTLKSIVTAYLFITFLHKYAPKYPQNIYVHQNKVAGHIRINKTGYKKTRISKAMQIKLEKLTVSKELNTIDSNKEVPYRAERVFA